MHICAGILISVFLPEKIFAGQSGGTIHLNKHYYTTGEVIWFAYYADHSIANEHGIPLFVSLLEIRQNHQYLKKAVKTKLVNHTAGGYLEVPMDLESGLYLIAVMPVVETGDGIDWGYSEIFIYNPMKPFTSLDSIMNRSRRETAINSVPDTLEIDSTVSRGNFIDNSSGLKVELEPINRNAGETVFVSGRVVNMEPGEEVLRLSASVVDERFNQAGMDVIAMESIPINSDTTDYIRGRLMINNKPAEIIKVYLYANKNGEIFLDKYITGYHGEFKFPDPAFKNDYSIKLMTYPDPGKSYHFQLTNQPRIDSIYRFPYRPGSPWLIEEYIDLARAQFLIESSYSPLIPAGQSKSSIRITDFASPSHRILLNDYIHFTTLPEIIREIIPMVTVKYARDKYEVRIWDIRASKYCCYEDPLVFVNSDPFLDITPIMELSPDSIESVEIIRPIEAIGAFGDIGVNGIMVINLMEGVSEKLLSSLGKDYFEVTGFQEEKNYVMPEFGIKAPDFRSFLYWNGDIEVDESGRFSFAYRNSLLSSGYEIAFYGITSRGRRISSLVKYKSSPVAEKN